MEDPCGPPFQAKFLAKSHGLGEYLGVVRLADIRAHGHEAIEDTVFNDLSSSRSR